MAKIIFNHVTKVFDGGVTALKNVSYELDPGEFLFVVGKSGAGKSTLLKLMTRQITPTSGEIRIDGRSLAEIEKDEVPFLNRRFGIMENEFGLLGDRNLYENVALALIATEMPRKIIRKRTESVLASVGLRKMADRYPSELSGGEAARGLLARAMVTDPEILLADEPTANLDPDTSWDIMTLLDDMSHAGITVVVASHDKEIVNIMRKRVITLSGGRIIGDVKSGRY